MSLSPSPDPGRLLGGVTHPLPVGKVLPCEWDRLTPPNLPLGWSTAHLFQSWQGGTQQPYSQASAGTPQIMVGSPQLGALPELVLSLDSSLRPSLSESLCPSLLASSKNPPGTNQETQTVSF